MYGTAAGNTLEKRAAQDVELAPSAALDEERVGTQSFPLAKFLLATILLVGAIAVLSSSGTQQNAATLTKMDAVEIISSVPVSDSPGTDRKPREYVKYSADLFAHPKVQAAFDDVKRIAYQHVYDTCFGPENNMDAYINEKVMDNDLMFNDGMTVFNLDCRDAEANPLIAFIVILDKQGQIVNVHNPPNRAESVNMYSTDTVLFSCISKGGQWLWNWKTDATTKLPWTMDAHTLNYVAATGNFYGLDRGDKFSPSTAVGYSSDGDRIWEYENEGSHINFLSIDGDYAYLSLRSFSCLVKVDMRTNQVIETIGGLDSDFTITDITGEVSTEGGWSHQHKFQHLDDKYASLFDNHVNNEKSFIEDSNSHMRVLKIDSEAKTVSEVFAFDTGDKSRIYGGADVLPSGNVLGNSYPMVVEPAVEDRQYHVNVWEVNMATNEADWRLAFKGRNPVDPANLRDPYPHYFYDPENPDGRVPTGWNIYTADRAYPTVFALNLCSANGGRSLRFSPFNTVRTQEDAPGVAAVVLGGGEPVAQKAFLYQKAWLNRPEEIDVPAGAGATFTFWMNNQWDNQWAQEVNMAALETCPP
uniref:Uncharacterized protein n=1 Tax=Heterosigma akashiwo TaxID=2829 RepID=A0A7S3XXJ8_HETAK